MSPATLGTLRLAPFNTRIPVPAGTSQLQPGLSNPWQSTTNE